MADAVADPKATASADAPVSHSTSPRRRLRPGLGPAAGALAALSALLQILTSPVLGLADNGDYKRVLNRLDLVAVRPPGQSRFQFLVLDHVPGSSSEQSYTSTELFFARAVQWLHDLLGFGPGMDLRVIGVAHALVLGVAVWLVVRALPGPLAVRGIAAGLLVVVVTDTRFVVYLNSFYTEPAGMLALLFLVAAVLHAWRRPVLSWWGLAAIGASSVALILSKSQNAVLVLPIAALLLARLVSQRRRTAGWPERLAPAALAALLLVLAVGFLQAQPQHLSQSNRYNAVFVEILGHSDDPVGDLEELGLDPALASYAGRAIYEPGNAVKDPRFGDFFERITHRRIATFYAAHTDRGLALAHRGATASMDLIPRGISPRLGTETRADSPTPVYDSCKLCAYSSVSRGLRGASAVLVPALWAAALTAAWALRRRDHAALTGGAGSSLSSAGVQASLLLVGATGFLSMATALLGEGEFEIVKHLYLGSVANALLAVLLVHAVGLLWWARRRPAGLPSSGGGLDEPAGRSLISGRSGAA